MVEPLKMVVETRERDLLVTCTQKQAQTLFKVKQDEDSDIQVTRGTTETFQKGIIHGVDKQYDDDDDDDLKEGLEV